MSSDRLTTSSPLAGRSKYEALNPSFQKSYAQVASSVAPPVSPVVAPHSARLRPIPQKRKTSQSHGVKLKDGELDLIRSKAAELGMSVNAYIRAKSLGHDYIERPPEWLRAVLLQLYAELAGQGNNLNQLARKVNQERLMAENAIAIVERERQPVLNVLRRLELALAGRRPPDDY